jgi:universal stress protein family protein
MSTTKSFERPRVVCHVDASSTAAAVVRAAGSYCRERDAELVVVWVLEPSSFQPTLPGSAGGMGIWGLAGAAAVALELAHREGVAARALVRIGDAARVLEDERRAVGAERAFTRADVALDTAVCGGRSQAARLESHAA